MVRFATNHGRLAAFVAALLSVGMLASASFAACCGHCGTGPKAAAESVHDCCPGKQAPKSENLRADCAGCHDLAHDPTATLVRVDSHEKAPAQWLAPTTDADGFQKLTGEAMSLANPERGPPLQRVRAHATTVLLL